MDSALRLVALVLAVAGTAAAAPQLAEAHAVATNPTAAVRVAPASTTTPPATTTTTPSAPPKTRLTSNQATEIFLTNGHVVAWIHRYPPNIGTEASYTNGSWTVNVFYGPAGEIATGNVDDLTGAVTRAWTGPQVAWGMARGGNGFGGSQINSPTVWLIFCAVFLLGLVDWRRLFSLRNLDLLVLLSFTASLWYFNHGNVFAAIPLVYPGFAYLIVRCLWIARRNTGNRGSVVWPVWVLVVATLCLVAFRIDLTSTTRT